MLRQGEFTIPEVASIIPVYLISSVLGPTTAAAAPEDTTTPSATETVGASPSSGAKEGGEPSTPASGKTPQPPVPSSSADRDGFDFQLDKPIVLDSFLNKLQNKASRGLRLGIEQCVPLLVL